MSAIEIKKQIVSNLNAIEDSFVLETVLSYVMNLKDSHKNSSEEIVAYSIDGKAISKKEYIKRNEQAVNSYKKGNFKTQEQLLNKYKKSI
jgi:hypothetical protein